MSNFAPATFILITQNPRLGGAERSLYEWILRRGERPHLICPNAGEWGELAQRHGWEMTVIPMPKRLASWSWRGRVHGATQWAVLLMSLACLPIYGWRLWRAMRRPDLRSLPVRTLGAKSHVLGLALLPWMRRRWVIDVRDFLRPRLLRRVYAQLASLGWARIIANSRAVAADYGEVKKDEVKVVYPRIALTRKPRPAQALSGRRIITHAAYFAPYKGQDLFLDFAAACLKEGLDAEFWLIGEVLYPAPEYAAYASRLRARASEKDLAGKVHFLGGLAADQVMQRLEQSHLLAHCTREPEPFGRILIEALVCGCEVVAHRGSGACEVTQVSEALPAWVPANVWATLGGVEERKNYVALTGVNENQVGAVVSIPD